MFSQVMSQSMCKDILVDTKADKTMCRMGLGATHSMDRKFELLGGALYKDSLKSPEHWRQTLPGTLETQWQERCHVSQ